MLSCDGFLRRGNALYDLLHERFPGHRGRGGILNVIQLGKDMGLSHETMYRALRGNRRAGFPEGKLSVGIATKIMDLSRIIDSASAIYIEDLLPFVWANYADFAAPAGGLENEVDDDDLLS